jgi:hypothetical protein
MTPVELEALTADIATNGLRHDVILYQGMILDGRNRLAACAAAGVEPTFTTHEGDDESALALVISENMQRRDLTPGQKALAAARRWGLGEHSKGGRPANGKLLQFGAVSLRDVSKQFKVTQQQITQARDLLVEAPDLAARVDGGEALAKMHQQLLARQAQERQRAQDMERCAAYREAIEAGKMTLEEAMPKMLEEERKAKEREEAEADSRHNWQTNLVNSVQWFERHFAVYDDAHLDWYGDADAPGGFDQDLTKKRVAEVIKQLERLQTRVAGGSHGPAKRKND